MWCCDVAMAAGGGGEVVGVLAWVQSWAVLEERAYRERMQRQERQDGQSTTTTTDLRVRDGARLKQGWRRLVIVKA